MPKYYVQSGNLKEAIDAKDYIEGIKKAFSNHMQKSACVDFADNMLVSEKGFFDPDDLKENVDRHKQNAHKMTKFSNNFILPKDSDLFIDINLIFDILEKREN